MVMKHLLTRQTQPPNRQTLRPHDFLWRMGGVGWDSTAINALGVFLYGKNCDATHPIERLQANVNKNGCNCPKKQCLYNKTGFPNRNFGRNNGGSKFIPGNDGHYWLLECHMDSLEVVQGGGCLRYRAGHCNRRCWWWHGTSVGFKTFIICIIMEWFCYYDASMMEHG